MMEMNPQKTKKSNNGPHPLWIGPGFDGAIFVVVIIGVTMLHFFLQFTLTAGNGMKPGVLVFGLLRAIALLGDEK